MNTMRFFRSGLMVAALSTSFVGVALASSFTTLNPFTQTELDTNWQADRSFPTDGVTSVSAYGRDDVARIGIDSTQTASSLFHRTEGIKTVGTNNFGTAAQVDLYLDPFWETNAVRAGFWLVGDNGSGGRDNYYGIVEFVHNDTHEGWRVWDSINGWTYLNTPYTYGQWTTLGIELDPVANEYHYFVDGNQIATGPAGENFIAEIFLNSYNFGLENYVDLGTDSYDVHWSAGATDPVSKDECKQGGFADFGFKNQGLCIQYVNTGKDSR